MDKNEEMSLNDGLGCILLLRNVQFMSTETYTEAAVYLQATFLPDPPTFLKSPYICCWFEQQVVAWVKSPWEISDRLSKFQLDETSMLYSCAKEMNLCNVF